MTLKNKRFSSKNKFVIGTFLGSAWVSFVFYLALRDQEKKIKSKTAELYNPNDPKDTGIKGMFSVPPSGVGLYAYEVIIPPNEGDSDILPGQDPLGKFNVLFPIGKTIMPAAMLGLASDVLFSKNEAPYPSIRSLAGITDIPIENLVKKRSDNQNLILDLFKIKKSGSSVAASNEKYEYISDSILLQDFDTMISGLISLAINSSEAYWYMRFENLFPTVVGVHPDTCKRSNSNLDRQRIGAAVLWALVQNMGDRHSEGQNDLKDILNAAIEDLKQDLIGDVVLYPDTKHLWMIQLFKEGCFNCETPGKNHMFYIDPSYISKGGGSQKEPPIDVSPAAGLAVLISGIVFYSGKD